MASTTVLPNGDGTLTAWQDQVGGTSNLYTRIDELTASPTDSDYIISTLTTNSMFFLLQDMPSDLGTVTDAVVKARVNRDSGSRTLTAQLFQSDESTALTNSQTTAALGGTITNYTLTHTITGATTKTAWDGARLKLTGSGTNINVYATQVDITYTVAADMPGSLVDGGLVKSKLVTGRLVV